MNNTLTGIDFNMSYTCSDGNIAIPYKRPFTKDRYVNLIILNPEGYLQAGDHMGVGSFLECYTPYLSLRLS